MRKECKMKRATQLVIAVLVFGTFINNSFAQQAMTDLQGLWKSNAGNVVKIDGNQGVLVETTVKTWEKYINKPIIKNITQHHDKWKVKELVSPEGRFVWVDITWELKKNRIIKDLIFLTSEEENYYERIGFELSEEEKASQPTPSVAEDLAAPGLYITASVGHAKLDYSVEGATDEDNTDTAYSVGIGYGFSNYIAIETGWLDLGQASASGVSGTFAGKPWTASKPVTVVAEADGFYLGPIVTPVVTEKFKAYAKVGVYFWDMDLELSVPGTLTYDGITYTSGRVDASESGEDLYFGFGASFDITEQFTVRTDWTRYEVYGESIDLIAVGIVFKFGKLF